MRYLVASASSLRLKRHSAEIQTIIFASVDIANVGDFVGDFFDEKLTDRQKKIISFIKESPTITAKQMSETLSVSQRTIERELSTLKEMKVLRREGKDNDGFWKILTNKSKTQKD